MIDMDLIVACSVSRDGLNDRQETVNCTHCTNGSVTIQGSMWWQTRKLRCSYCQGTGRIFKPETSGLSNQNSAPSAAPGESTPASAGHARSAAKRAISPASQEQRAKTRDAQCLNCGHPGCDPAHLTSRAQGGCDSPLCVIPLCRACHRAFDDGTLDLEPVIALHEHRLERAHMAQHLTFRQCLRRLNGRAA